MSSVAQQARPAELDSSFETLYRAHRATVYRSLLRDLHDPDEAEDVTQATFLNAYRALGRGDRPESPRAWLLAIARNVCRRRFRARSLRPVEVGLDPELVEAPEEYDGPGAAEIHAAIATLRPSHRAVILMREFWGLSYDEIATQLGISHSAVETLLFRARRRLRYELEAAESRPGRARGLLALPFPASLASWFDSAVTALSRSGLAARAAGLAAAAALGTTVALEAGTADPAPPPVRPAAAPPALVPAPVAAPTDAELALHAAAAEAAALEAETAVAAPIRAEPGSKDASGTTVDLPPVAVGDVGVLDVPEVQVPELEAPALEAPALEAPQVDVPDVSLEEPASVLPETDDVTATVDDLLP